MLLALFLYTSVWLRLLLPPPIRQLQTVIKLPWSLLLCRLKKALVSPLAPGTPQLHTGLRVVAQVLGRREGPFLSTCFYALGGQKSKQKCVLAFARRIPASGCCFKPTDGKRGSVRPEQGGPWRGQASTVSPGQVCLSQASTVLSWAPPRPRGTAKTEMPMMRLEGTSGPNKMHEAVALHSLYCTKAP